MMNFKNKRLSITFWVLTAICMGVIFYFSSRTADESSSQSSWILTIITRLFGNNGFTDFIIRKSAHFLEFTGLCVLFNFSFLFTKGKKFILPSIALTSLYAITDEVHQIFIEGRSCQFSDWCIDTAGAVAGAIGFLILIAIIKLIIDKSKKKS